MQFVYVAYDLLTRRHIALKTPKNQSGDKRFRRGAIVAAKVNHPNVAKTLDYLEFEGKKYLVEELVNGVDLRQALMQRTRSIDPFLAAKVFHHLARGVAAAHHANVIHRDLKPTNVMVVGGYSLTELKITDFGIAKLIEDEFEKLNDSTISASQTAVGALPYMSPESIEDDKSQPVGAPSDVWSIGAMMFHLLTGDYPFGEGLKAVSKIVAAQPPCFPQLLFANPQFSPLANDLKELILACLKKNPTERPTADKLVVSCGQLCYPVSARYLGKVKSFQHGSWGFIQSELGEIFFHRECVFGDVPQVGDSVSFSCFVGGGAPRAMPVIRLEQ